MKKNISKKISALCLVTCLTMTYLGLFTTNINAQDKVTYTVSEWVETSSASTDAPIPVYVQSETVHYNKDGDHYRTGVINYVDENGNYLFGDYVSRTNYVTHNLYFSEGLALVCKEQRDNEQDLFAYIDTQGNEVFTFEANDASQFTNGNAIIVTDSELHIINTKGDKIKSISKGDGYYSFGEADNGYFFVEEFMDGSGFLFDTNLNKYDIITNGYKNTKYISYVTLPDDQGIVLMVGYTEDYKMYYFFANVDGDLLVEFEEGVYLEHIEGNKYLLEKDGETKLLEISGDYSNAGNTSTKSDEIRATVNGVEVTFDQAPIIKDGRTLVPMRAIFVAMGADVKWDADTRTVTGTKGDTVVNMTIDNTIININGNSVTLDVAPTIVNGRTMVPARAVAEAFSANVKWDNDTRTILITQ